MKTTDMIRNAVRSSFTLSCAAATIFSASAGAQLPSSPSQPAPSKGEVSALRSAVCSLINGYSFNHPGNWRPYRASNGLVKLEAPGHSESETYIFGNTPSNGVKSTEDPNSIAAADALVAKLLPSLRRIDKPYRMKTGIGPAMSLEFSGNTDDGEAVYARVYLSIHNDRTVSFFAVANREIISSRGDVLDAIFSSMRSNAHYAASAPTSVTSASSDTTPLAREWMQRLNGKKLTRLSGYSSGSSGGYSSQSELVLMANGRFSYNSSSSVAIYVDGANGGSSSRNQSAGTWRILDQGGTIILELRSEGNVDRRTMTYRDGKTFMNGGRVYVTQP